MRRPFMVSGEFQSDGTDYALDRTEPPSINPLDACWSRLFSLIVMQENGRRHCRPL
jgi:hypothetical protein